MSFIYWCSLHYQESRILLKAAHPVILFLSRLKTNKDHFPSTYSEAQCLCSGCILIQDSLDEENAMIPAVNYDYNSVPIKQNRVFLKRELCSDGKKYHLKPVTVEVAVGCVCARASTSS